MQIKNITQRIISIGHVFIPPGGVIDIDKSICNGLDANCFEFFAEDAEQEKPVKEEKKINIKKNDPA